MDVHIHQDRSRTPSNIERENCSLTIADLRMSAIAEIEQGIESLLTESPYGLDSSKRRTTLLGLLKNEIAYACERNAGFRNYVGHWPTPFQEANDIADLPYLPVGAFKANPPLALVPLEEVKR